MSEQTEKLGALPTEARNPRSEAIDRASTLEMLRIINDEDATIAAAVQARLPTIAQIVDEVSIRFEREGRLFYVGAGTSGRLGVLDASECPPTFSVPAGLFIGVIAGGDGALRTSSESTEDQPGQGARDLLAYGLRQQDTVIGIAASGRTPYVMGALEAAVQEKALTVALTCAGGTGVASPMAALSEIAVELATGAEVITGSTRMKAGTATKMVLNMISTGVMIRRGAVYGNLMVHVQPTNAKLVNRAQRIISAATGFDDVEAGRLLQEGVTVKVAIVMGVLGVGRIEAEERLAQHGGRLSEALRG